jgi:geranylgeranyl pyrophosphate synthase
MIFVKSVVAPTMSNQAQPPENLFAAYQIILGERLHLLLEALPPLLRTDVVSVLEGEGKLLSNHQTHSTLPAGLWPLLTFLIAQYISPDIDPISASSVAIAVECFVCALDLLDDVEDDDQTPIVRALGVARTLNVSTTLLMLAQKAILSLAQQEFPAMLVLRMIDSLQQAALKATAGQHRDLLAEQRLAKDLTSEECIEIAAGKAGSIMQLACCLGAICAGAGDVLYEQFSQLGELLGIAHQLDNDSHDLYYLLLDQTSAVTRSGTASVKSDLTRGKKTLPVVLAAKMEDALQNTPFLVDEEKEEHLRALHEGIITTWGICLLYRERAHDRLREIEAQRPITPTLKLLLGFS